MPGQSVGRCSLDPFPRHLQGAFVVADVHQREDAGAQRLLGRRLEPRLGPRGPSTHRYFGHPARGHREVQVLAARVLECRDAHQPALVVEQPAAAGAARHRRAGLDDERAGARPQAGDQSFAQRQLQALRCTDGVHTLADLELGRRDDAHSAAVQLFDLELAQVALHVRVLQARRQPGAAYPHLDRRRAADGVAARHHPARPDHDAAGKTIALTGGVQPLHHDHAGGRALEHLLGKCGASGQADGEGSREEQQRNAGAMVAATRFRRQLWPAGGSRVGRHERNPADARNGSWLGRFTACATHP